jgi:glycosyltransferase involved in cell wall biosynthesis
MADRWDQFDAVYVHGDASLAHAVAQRRPTVLRLPGPVAHDFASLLHGVHAVCANGDALERLRALLGDRGVELPVGVDEQRFHAGPSTVRSRVGWTANDVVVGYVGRLAHVKGVDLLATAFRAISGAIPDARLLIVGRGEEETGLRATLSDELARGTAHIESDVSHDELALWYRAMDVLVMPSRYENFSNAMLEAMACGVPFLASKVGGNRSLADSGAGWLFERESIASLQAVLAGVLANRTEVRARGSVAARYVRARYSWRASAERLEQIMLPLVGEAA